MKKILKRAAAVPAALLVLAALLLILPPQTAFAAKDLGDGIYSHNYQGWFGSGLDSLLIACFRTAIPEDAVLVTPGGEVIARREITYVDGMHLMNAVSANDSGPRTHAYMRLTHLWRDAAGNPVYCYDYATDDNGTRALYSFDDLPASYVNRDRFVRAWQMASALSADGFALLKANLRGACRDVTSVVDPSWVMSGEVTYQALVNDTNALQAIVQECVWLVMHDASAGEIQVGTSFGGGGQWIHTKDGDVWTETGLQSETAENGTFIDFALLIGVGTGAGAPYGTPDLVSSGSTPGDITNPGASGGQLLVVVKLQEPTGFLRVRKVSADPGMTGGNRMYPLGGITFRVYADEDCTEPAAGPDGAAVVLTTNERGVTGTAELAPGVYWVREDASTVGNWVWNEQPVRVEVTADRTAEAPAEASVANEPAACPVGIFLTKVDAETGESRPQGTASLEGARFTVEYYDAPAASGEPLRTWEFGTDADGVVRMDAAHLISGDEPYTASGRAGSGGGGAAGQFVIPAGTVTIRETQAPVGYLENETVHTVHITARGGAAVPDVPFVRHGNTADLRLRCEEQIIRADLKFSKLDIDGSPMAGVRFRIDLLDAEGDTVESHEAVTDENGQFDTSAGDTGIRFGGPSAGGTDRGALIFGRYRVTELPCAANAGHDLLAQEFTVSEDGKVYELSAVFIDLVIHLESDLIDDASGTRTVTLAEETPVTDTFRYDHLKTSKTYVLETEIVWVSEDGSGRESLGSGRVTFVPESQDGGQTAGGTVRNTVAVRTLGLNGGTLHAVDRLYQEEDGEEILLTTHNEDLSEERQTLRVPWIGTTAADTASGDHIGTLSGEASVTDVVEYRGLADGMYRLEGTLRDAETGEAVAGPDGEPCAVTRLLRVSGKLTDMQERGEMTAGPADGEVTMPEFRFDACAYAGRTLVVTEVLFDYDTGAALLAHDDLSDEDQQVSYLRITTSASAADTGDHVAGNLEECVITDVVTYEGLRTDGSTYTLRGYLADGETGGPVLVGGAHVEAETEFVPEEPSGQVAMTFTFDASALGGTRIAVFEELLHEGVSEAVHADPEDADQMVYIPAIRTSARDAGTGIDHTRAESGAELIDNVCYSMLLPDREYTLRGYLVNRNTGEPLTDAEGARIESGTVFTPETSEGSVDVTFPFDADRFSGVPVVVFEELYLGETLLVSHADIDDEEQSGYIPEIRTNAVFAETGEHIAEAAGQVTVVDTVMYEGLRPDTKYVLTGTLTDRETGGTVSADGRPVTAAVTFVTGHAEEAQSGSRTVSGSVDVEFTFDASVLAGRTLTACETLTREGREVAVHADLNDEAQTVYLPGVATRASDRRSGTQELSLGTRSVLVDEVDYEDLLPGRTYTVRGTVMDRASGTALRDAEGEPVTAETVFAPETPDGTAEVEFRIDTSGLHGRELVVFERLYTAAGDGSGNGGGEDELLIARHEDLNAASQTVRVPERPSAVLTGDRARPAVLIGLCVCAGGAAVCCGSALIPARDRLFPKRSRGKEASLSDADQLETGGMSERKA